MSFSAKLKFASSSDERDAERYRLLLKATGESDAGVVDVTVHDISAVGFLIEADALLSEGSNISLDIPGVGQVSAEIVWNSGNFFGGQFERALPESAVRAVFAESTVVWPNFAQTSAASRAAPQDRVFEPTIADPKADRWPLTRRFQTIVGLSIALWVPIGWIVWRSVA